MILFSEEDELTREREQLRGRWKRAALTILLAGALFIAAGVVLFDKIQEFGAVFVLLGVCTESVGLQFCYNLCTHKEQREMGLRSAGG
jgi:uncharacterized membrane protein